MRVGRYVINAPMLISLFLCISLMALWVRSHYIADAISTHGEGVFVSQGVVEFWIHDGRWRSPTYATTRPAPRLVHSWHGFGTDQSGAMFPIASLYMPLWFFVLAFMFLPLKAVIARHFASRRD